MNALEYAVRYLSNKSPKFLQVSGISFKIDISIKSTVEVDENDIFTEVKGNRRVYDIKIGGKKLDPNESYKVSFDNNIGTGGDGYSMFRKNKVILNTNKSRKDALITYIKDEFEGEIPDKYKNTEERIIIKQKSKDKDNNSSKTFIIIIIIIVLIIIIIFAIIIIYKKKKSSSGKISSSMENVNDNLLSL